MSAINKHYTFQEYIEKFSSIQDSYDYYFELQKLIDNADTKNLELIVEINNREEEIERLKEDIGNYVKIVLHDRKQIDILHSIIKEVREELNKIDSATYQGYTDKKTYYKYEQTRIQKLLEILDKVGNNEDN